MALAVSACATGSTAAPDLPAAIAASREFQRGYDQQLRDDPASFLTTVAAYYLAPGDAIAAPVTSEIELTLEADDEALTVFDGTERRRFEDGGVLELDDRHTLSISRQELDWRVLVHDQQAPLRAEFPGVAWFPVDARFIVTARYRPSSPREPMLLQTSRGVSKTLYVAGEAEFAIAGVTATLLVFGYAPEPGPGETMLIPFRDASSGRSSYAAGRYLEIDAPTGAELLLDFNRATNPLCAYSEHFNCPMPPQFNVLPVAIEAGARSPH
ncbi:MAG TPA: DUF1684 domain-containing protein [Enhygromyxa sp.]|nr:DUF1684 domain-containing protein [Enhygromyxa sp.]